ncbi:MAG: tetratricopeptide repeat protein [Spirochaetia bacterium]
MLHLSKTPQALQEIKTAQVLLQDNIGTITDPVKLLKLISLTYYRNRHFGKAVYFSKKALKHDYQDPDMHMLLAEAYRNLGELEKAKNHYQRAIESDPNRIQLYYGLAVILWEQHAYQALSEHTAHILRHNPEDKTASYFRALSLANLNSDPQDVIPLLQKQIRIHGPDPNLMFCLGKEYLNIQLPELAENWLRRTLDLVTDHKNCMLLLETVYKKLKLPKKGIGILKTYVSLFPEDIATRKRFVRLLLGENKYNEAAREITKLVTRETGNLKLKRALAFCYQKTERYGEAILILKEVLKQEPESVEDLRVLLFCLDKIGNRKTAILLLESALKFIKPTPGLMLTLGSLYAKQKDYEKAANIFRDVIEMDPQNWKGYYNLGMVYKKSGNTAFAEKFLQRAKQYR